jgi:hypothetical protein
MRARRRRDPRLDIERHGLTQAELHLDREVPLVVPAEPLSAPGPGSRGASGGAAEEGTRMHALALAILARASILAGTRREKALAPARDVRRPDLVVDLPPL